MRGEEGGVNEEKKEESRWREGRVSIRQQARHQSSFYCKWKNKQETYQLAHMREVLVGGNPLHLHEN